MCSVILLVLSCRGSNGTKTHSLMDETVHVTELHIQCSLDNQDRYVFTFVDSCNLKL